MEARNISTTCARVVFIWLSFLPSLVLAQRASVDAPPLSAYADTESSTNVIFNAGNADARLFRLGLELNATISNNVTIAFGTDSNTNGVLEHAEADVVVGWDSGSWFYQDRISGEGAHVDRPAGHRRLNWELTSNSHRTAKSVKAVDADGVVFSGVLPSSMFSPDWNLMQVTARGLTEPGGIVVTKVLGFGFKVMLK